MRAATAPPEADVALPDARAIRRASERIRGGVRRTPLQRSPWLSDRAGLDVHLKLECWQRTGSFKLRGALNAVRGLPPERRRAGLVAASAGNHGQAVALAASLHQVPATIFVPRSAPETKKAGIRREGAELREVDGSYDAAATGAVAFAADRGATYIHPFADADVVAGQGTVGLEILEDLPAVRTVLVPVGGGGLAAGVGAALRAALGGVVAVHGVQSTRTRAMYDAFEAGRVVDTVVEPTLCDGLAGGVEPESYAAAREALHGLHLVDEERIPSAVAGLFQHEGLVAEGSAAVGVAAVLQGSVPLEGPAVLVVTGGNIDARTFARILLEED